MWQDFFSTVSVLILMAVALAMGNHLLLQLLNHQLKEIGQWREVVDILRDRGQSPDLGTLLRTVDPFCKGRGAAHFIETWLQLRWRAQTAAIEWENLWREGRGLYDCHLGYQAQFYSSMVRTWVVLGLIALVQVMGLSNGIDANLVIPGAFVSFFWLVLLLIFWGGALVSIEPVAALMNLNQRVTPMATERFPGSTLRRSPPSWQILLPVIEIVVFTAMVLGQLSPSVTGLLLSQGY